MVSSSSRATRVGSAGGSEAAGSARRRRACRVSSSTVMAAPPLCWYMSGRTLGLSELLAQPLLGPVQPDAHGVGCHAEHGRDLRRRQLLPGPQPEQLGLVGVEPGQGLGGASVVLVGVRRAPAPGVERRDPARHPLACRRRPRSALARQWRATAYAQGSAGSGTSSSRRQHTRRVSASTSSAVAASVRRAR